MFTFAIIKTAANPLLKCIYKCNKSNPFFNANPEHSDIAFYYPPQQIPTSYVLFCLSKNNVRPKKNQLLKQQRRNVRYTTRKTSTLIHPHGRN